MAQISYRANLSAKSFPFNVYQSGRTVIVPGPDNTFNRSVSSAADVDRDVGIPQIIYGHNILPSQEGFNSVKYERQINAYDPVVGSNVALAYPPYVAGVGTVPGGLRRVVFMQENATRYYLAWGYVGNTIFVYNNPEAASPVPLRWNEQSGELTPAVTDSNSITVALYNGVTYVYCYDRVTPANNKLLEAEASVMTLLADPTGLSISDTLGIISSSGYLIAYTNSAVAWSLDIGDFTPSLLTGAGGGDIQEAKGAIKYASATNFGFILYCESNAVAAVYTGNSRSPFVFNEIKGAGGFVDQELIADNSNGDVAYAWTLNGMQLIGPKTATNFLPGLTDFIRAGIIQDYDTSTETFNLIPPAQNLRKKLTLVGNRYLILSYGSRTVLNDEMSHAIVYDITLQRYGKLKINHVEVFEGFWGFLKNSVAVADRDVPGIAFMSYTGYVVYVDANVLTQNSGLTFPIDSCLMLGKYQYVRSRRLILDKVWVESQALTNDPLNKVIDYSSFNGKSFEATATGYKYTAESGTDSIGQASYLFNLEGLNHSLMFIGNWSWDSVQLDFHVAGRI